MLSRHQETFYFGAGPATLPREVLDNIREELHDYRNSGLSILELSHRSELFTELLDDAEHLLRELMAISNDYAVLFLHGGATAQYSMLPLNFLGEKEIADYVCTGHWSRKACEEAKQFANVNEINVLDENEKVSIKPIQQWKLNSDAVYLHYCNNETIDGVSFSENLKFKNKLLFCDMTSSILAIPVEVNKYDLIYASAQKNLGIAGLCILIIKKTLLNKVKRSVPRIYNYALCEENNSLVNTPPTFAIYVLCLMLKWLKSYGGVNELSDQRQKYVNDIYSLIDDSALYKNNVDDLYRSCINIPFSIENKTLQEKFLQQAEGSQLLGLRGHKNIGGLRISLYNAMPIQGVKKLIDFMHDFESSHMQ